MGSRIIFFAGVALALCAQSSFGVLDRGQPAPAGVGIATKPGVTAPNSGLCGDWEAIYREGAQDGYFCTVDWEPIDIDANGCRVHNVHCVGPRGPLPIKTCLDGPSAICGIPIGVIAN